MKDNNYNTELDLLTDVALDVNESANSISVLLKHDYYSTDNENGKALLNSLLDGLILAADRINMIIITDSAVRLLESSSKLINLIKLVHLTLVCRDSANFYEVQIPEDEALHLNIVPISDITDQIIESRPNLIIE